MSSFFPSLENNCEGLKKFRQRCFDCGQITFKPGKEKRLNSSFIGALLGERAMKLLICLGPTQHGSRTKSMVHVGSNEIKMRIALLQIPLVYSLVM